MTEKEQQLEREIRSLKKEIEILNSIAELKSRFKPILETEIETEKGFWNYILNIWKPRTIIKQVHYTNTDFYPAYKEEREWRSRAEKENRELREELWELKTKHMKEKDKHQDRIYELEGINEKLSGFVETHMGKLL